MNGWPIHEYDPSPELRKLRRSLLVLGEHFERDAVNPLVLPVIRWLDRQAWVHWLARRLP